jgi:acyl-CoA thioester hydrolase
VSFPAFLPAALYQGSANSWECDEGGHLNVRFQFERALIGLAHLARALEMPGAFAKSACATLVPLEAHVRFLKEARPGAALVMHGGVVELGESQARVCLDMRHGDGAPASAFTLVVAHADTRGFRPFPWSARTRAAAQRLACTQPAHALPRSIDVSKPPASAARISLARARELGAQRIGASLVSPDQCDAFERLRGEHLLGRLSDSAPNLLAGWRGELAAEAQARGETIAPVGAVVEARLMFRAWPGAGALIEVHSALVEVGDKTLRICHWLLDPESGRAWASAEVIALTFDALTRKSIAPSPELRARIQARTAPAMEM